MMKNIILILTFLLINNIYGQNKKETVYLLFDINSCKMCKVEVDFSSDNDGKLDGYGLIKKYRKLKIGKSDVFCICDEKFFFNPRDGKTDNCSVKSLKKLNIKSIDYMKNKYQKGQYMKHNLFKQINIVEKISDTKIVIYLDVHWAGEWIIE